MRKRTAVFVDTPEELRWELKRAALDERRTMKELVIRILTDWLGERGYRREVGTLNERERQRQEVS